MRWNAEADKALAQLCVTGLSRALMAEVLGCTESAITYRIHKLGLCVCTKHQLDTIVKYKNQKKSVLHISKRTGLSVDTITQIWSQHRDRAKPGKKPASEAPPMPAPPQPSVPFGLIWDRAWVKYSKRTRCDNNIYWAR